MPYYSSSGNVFWIVVLILHDVRARVIGVQAQMETFDYYFGVCIGKLVLGHADNLSAALQKSILSAAEEQ